MQVMNAEKTEAEVLVFDEIDVGSVVARRKLWDASWPT
jgi:DNA repair ATPase RecN